MEDGGSENEPQSLLIQAAGPVAGFQTTSAHSWFVLQPIRVTNKVTYRPLPVAPILGQVYSALRVIVPVHTSFFST